MTHTLSGLDRGFAALTQLHVQYWQHRTRPKSALNAVTIRLTKLCAGPIAVGLLNVENYITLHEIF